jgi:hypothetical protein
MNAFFLERTLIQMQEEYHFEDLTLDYHYEMPLRKVLFLKFESMLIFDIHYNLFFIRKLLFFISLYL